MSLIAEKHNIKFMNFSKLNKTSKKKNCLLINCVGGEIYKKELLKLANRHNLDISIKGIDSMPKFEFNYSILIFSVF